MSKVEAQRVQIAEVARELRQKSEQTAPAFSTRRLIERCFPDVLVTGGQLPDGVDEAVKRTKDGPVILYARKLSGPEQRFAIAHAVAHLIFDGDAEGYRGGRVGAPDREQRADLFAAEYLVPFENLRDHIRRGPSPDPTEHEIYLDEVDEISSVFVVPAQIIDARIRKLILHDRFVSRSWLTNW